MSRQRGRILAVTRQPLLVGLILTLAVSCGISEDKQKNQELLRASKEGRLEDVIRLLNSGANVNAKNEEGATPLMEAAWEGQIEIVKVLLDKGAQVNAKEKDGETPLMWAAAGDHIEIMKLLLNRGADVKARSKNGETAFSGALT